MSDGTDRHGAGSGEPGPARILVKLRPSPALRAAESRLNLRPLRDKPETRDALLGVGAEPEWFVAELPEPLAAPVSMWDAAHSRVANELGIAPSDLIFAEPDLVHGDAYRVGADDELPAGGGSGFAAGSDCAGKMPQEGKGGQALGPDDVFGWHLDDDRSQLASARDAVAFAGTRTRIAHLDTGYWPAHLSTPVRVLSELERNFAEDDAIGSASDPGRRHRIMDNSGHGTGTLGILAGQAPPSPMGTSGSAGSGSAPWTRALGGAPDADIVPLRIAGRVVLLRTSAFAAALHYAVDARCDVVTMSMGGLPSRAWREAIDRAYLGGVCVVSAAGNNFSGAPTRNLVYPARYRRVIAACGVMADGRPYSGLGGLRTMEGNHGPARLMDTAIAAYTPNIPWAVMGCEDRFRMNGAGTSSATPQVAAAAALWFERYKTELARDWTRVEAVRHALFKTAVNPTGDRARLGNGILRARDALEVGPVLGLPQTPADRDSFAFLRVLTGLGIDGPTPRDEMFDLEIAQRWLLNPRLRELIEDPDGVGAEAAGAEGMNERTLRSVVEALIEDEGASTALRRHLEGRWSTITGRPVPPRPGAAATLAAADPLGFDRQPVLRDPPFRKLRVYATDPSFSARHETAAANEVTLEVRWEGLHRGPIGEYLAIRDTAGGPGGGDGRRSSVDLDDPRLLARDGWSPSEGNPHFHQQMVYAVAMKTIEHFEEALGRPVLWRAASVPGKPHHDGTFVQRLTVRPHAFRGANAYYSPTDAALLFGYFDAPADDPGDFMPGSRVYTCLSHDIIAHETTHAILDGMQRRFSEPTNPDVLAFHEAFADIVALMQHFTLPGVLEAEIARTRGDIESESWLGSLAVQFGHATGRGGALRDAIGRHDDAGRWVRNVPDPTELSRRLAPHARGAILVAAVFDAFVTIYNARTADLYRIYTGGTGVLGEGAIHPDLVGRLAGEAERAASHVLAMCIRALDYLPPVDVTFFEYLRALITADADVVPRDRYHYRVAFVEAFRKWGIYPIDLSDPGPDTPRTLSVDTLRWQGLEGGMISGGDPEKILGGFDGIVKELKRYADACFYIGNREELFGQTREYRRKVHSALRKAFREMPELAREVGLEPGRSFEVHELRRAMRVSPTGSHVPQIIVSLTQSVTVKENRKTGAPAHTFRGGSTLIVDLTGPRVMYRIVKRVSSARRRARTADFLSANAADPLRSLFVAPGSGEPFGVLHALSEEL